MRLDLQILKINDIRFGGKTAVRDGTLYVNRDELIKLVLQDSRLSEVDVELAMPGEEVRIIPVKDVIEPRVKLNEEGDFFPGLVGKMTMVGLGRTSVLRGVAVVTVGKIVGFQEGLIDMAGPAALYSPFSQTNNIVLVLQPTEGLTQHNHEEAIRLAGLRAAVYLGKAGKGVKPDEVDSCELSPTSDAGLPRVAYIYPLLAEGLLHDTYFYGMDVKKLLPTLIHPNEVLDGALVSGNCVSACDKNTTFHHLNNPIIKELYRRHGRDLNFVGIIITNLNVTLADKENASDHTSKLVKLIGAEGVIISKEGFGNPDTDLMMLCRKMEESGVRTVLITDEYAGMGGTSQSLTDSSHRADAVVSTGNANDLIALLPMKRIIGDLKSADVIAGGFVGSVTAGRDLNVEIQAIIGATCQLGFNKLTARGY